MIRLYIEGSEVELNEQVQFAITKQFEDLSKPTLIKNDWSKTVSIPFTLRNHYIFGQIYNPDKLTVYTKGNNQLRAPSSIKKWNGTSYVNGSLVGGNIVCDQNVEYLQLSFQYAGWTYSTTQNYKCNNDSHMFEFVYNYDNDYRLEFSFRNPDSSAPNGEVMFVQWELFNLGLTPGDTYVVSFTHSKDSNGNYVISDFTLSKKQPYIGVNFDPLKKLDFRLEYDNSILMTGYAKMNEIKQINGNGTYNITLFGQLGKIFQELAKITFDTATEDTSYLINGSQYVNEYISKDLIYQMWTRNGQQYSDLYKKGDTYYNVCDIIGFAPNNAISEGFDYKNLQIEPNASQPFNDLLGNNFKEATGVDPDNVLPYGMMPRGFGEYRSYLQLPYIYWNKLFRIFIEKTESLTGYKCELDNEWFNTNNPYWYNLVYMLKPLDVKNEDTYSNLYMFASFGLSYGSNINEYVQPKTTNININITQEAVHIIDSNNMILLSDDYSVIFNTIVTFSLNNGRYNNLRINPNNGLQVSFLVEDSNSNVLDEIKYLMVDNDYAGSVDGYRDVLRFGRKGSGVMEAYPKLDLVLDKGKYGNKVKLVLKTVWLNTNAPYLDNNNQPFTPTSTGGNVIFNLYNVPINKPVSCMVIKNRFRSFNNFTLNTLWNKDYKIFNEILKYCQMYRIIISVDEANKKIYFKSAVNYFENYSIKDWTNKVDKSKDFILKPVTFENKYVLFNYKENDSKIYKDYKTKYGINYGEYRLMTDYNFNNETTQLFNEITPSVTNTDNVLSWTNLKENHKIIYSFPNEIYVYNKDKENKQVDIFGAFYFYTGLSSFNTETNLYLRDVYLSDDTDFQASNSNYCFIATNIENNKRKRVFYYPKLDVIMNNLLCLFNIPMENYTYINNYGNAKSIYYNFWQKYLNERYNIQNKLLTCYVTLKPSDITNFDWNNLIKIGNQLYIVNKIYDYNITSNEPTKVDLVSIQDISSYYTNNYN